MILVGLALALVACGGGEVDRVERRNDLERELEAKILTIDATVNDLQNRIAGTENAELASEVRARVDELEAARDDLTDLFARMGAQTEDTWSAYAESTRVALDRADSVLEEEFEPGD